MFPSLPSWECGLKLHKFAAPLPAHLVTPFVGVWIEILSNIEDPHAFTVTPFVGVWIEIASAILRCSAVFVTPFVGVWIEIVILSSSETSSPSLPSWECGLK